MMQVGRAGPHGMTTQPSRGEAVARRLSATTSDVRTPGQLQVGKAQT